MIANQPPELWLTLWPSFPHFRAFATDPRISAIRLNSAKISPKELKQELEFLSSAKIQKPLYFDVKGRQLRVVTVNFNPHFLDININHPITVNTPTTVLLKGGKDQAVLQAIVEDGQRLIFEPGNPEFLVTVGESLCIRDECLQIHGPTFHPIELEKIALVRGAGWKRFFLSYAHNQEEVDELLQLVGLDCEIMIKIENRAGLAYVQNEFQKQSNLSLVAARGDLYLEIHKPHEILEALKLIIVKDPQAIVGSRLLLSLIDEPVPSCADLLEIAWLYEVGYRRMMLCDEICLQKNLLTTAVNVFDTFGKELIK